MSIHCGNGMGSQREANSACQRESSHGWGVLEFGGEGSPLALHHREDQISSWRMGGGTSRAWTSSAVLLAQQTALQLAQGRRPGLRVGSLGLGLQF